MDDIVTRSLRGHLSYSGPQQSPKQRKNGSQGVSGIQELGLNAKRKLGVAYGKKRRRNYNGKSKQLLEAYQ